MVNNYYHQLTHFSFDRCGNKFSMSAISCTIHWSLSANIACISYLITLLRGASRSISFLSMTMFISYSFNSTQLSQALAPSSFVWELVHPLNALSFVIASPSSLSSARGSPFFFVRPSYISKSLPQLNVPRALHKDVKCEYMRD